jgi:hypothetical protein
MLDHPACSRSVFIVRVLGPLGKPFPWRISKKNIPEDITFVPEAKVK